MKKILLIISLISVLLLAGCNSNQDSEIVNVEYENLRQEIAKKDETIKELENQIDELRKTNIDEEKSNFDLRAQLYKLDFSSTLVADGYEISEDGKTIKNGEEIINTNLSKNIKSFKVGRNGMTSNYFLALTIDGELYFSYSHSNGHFELLDGKYDGIYTFCYDRSDGMKDPFIARSKVENEFEGYTFADGTKPELVDVYDYTIFTDKDNKIRFYSHRP